MYDRKSEANEFVAESLEEATAEAARFYEVEADQLKVIVPRTGEISGAAGRTVIVALPSGMAVGKPGSGGDGGSRGDRGERESKGSRGRERGRDRDKGGRSKAREEEKPAAEGPKTESKGTVEGEAGELGEFLLGVVERMKLGSFTLVENEEDDFVVYQLRGEASEALGAGDGRATDALQLVVNQAAKRIFEDPPRVVVDVEVSGEGRQSSLEKLASRAAARAVDTGRAIALDPMNGRDRRVVHMTLRETEKIATMSIGSGRYRQVVVVPEGAPEYDEAVEASRSS